MRTLCSRTMAALALLIFCWPERTSLFCSSCRRSCTTLVNFATIQQAVNAVPAGSTIRICPGTYHEQVTISEKLILEGVVYGQNDAVVILPPAAGLVQNAVDVDDSSSPIAAQILVENTAGPVAFSNLTVDGTGNKISSCAPDLQGILFQNASGSVTHVAVRNETLSAGLGGCQSGESIYVQTAAGLTSTVSVVSSSVHNYNKNGITGNECRHFVDRDWQLRARIGRGSQRRSGAKTAFKSALEPLVSSLRTL